MGWKITAPALTKEERDANVQAEKVAQRTKHNKAARNSRRTNRK